MVDHHANPFVYGRVLSPEDAACARPEYERAIVTTVRDKARLALVGDRRLGKSTLIERTLAARNAPYMRVDFHGVLSFDDLVHRFAEGVETLVRSRSLVAKHVVPWLREVGRGVGVDQAQFQWRGGGLQHPRADRSSGAALELRSGDCKAPELFTLH